MTKHFLMLSAATAALLAAPAFAQTTISTSVTTEQKTATTGDLTISSGGSVAISIAGVPAVELNSNNFVLNQGSIANSDKTGAIGVFVNATANPVVPTYGFSNLGNIILNGSGVSKIGVQVAGVGGTYTGDIYFDPSLSNIQISGDGAIGVVNDFAMTTKGNFNLGGVITISASSPSSLTDSLGYLVKQWGTLYGNLTIAQGSQFNAIGQNNFGVAILGDILNCNSATTVAAACTADNGKGTFFNGGNVNVVGTFVPSGSQVNPEGAYALGIGANINDGVLNSGPINTSNTVTPASFVGNGVGIYPTVLINPLLLTGSPREITIGVFTTDNVNPGYSFYNRGYILAQPSDSNIGTTAMSIAGSSSTLKTFLTPTAAQITADPTLAGKGGIFNSGAITATATSKSSVTASAITATALQLEAFSVVPRITVSGETVTSLNSSLGVITATVDGPMGGTATAIFIADQAIMPDLNIVKGGKVQAGATTTDTAITTLNAIGVRDVSNTLKTINNSGTISGGATALNLNTQIVRAIDLSASTGDNIMVNNSGLLVGDIMMGQSGNNHRLFVGNVGAVGTNTMTGFGSGGGLQNSSTGVTNAPTASGSANGPALISGDIDFGIGGTDAAPNVLHIGGSGIVQGKIFSRGAGVLDVRVDGNGTLTVANTQETLRTRVLNINGGTLNLSISQGTLATVPLVTARDSATIATGSNIGLAFGGFISSPDPNAPVEQTFALISAPVLNLNQTQVDSFNNTLTPLVPFLFQSPNTTGTPLLSIGTYSSNPALLLKLKPKAPGAGANTTHLNLSGNALAVFPFVNAALVNDNQLGAALVNGITNQATAQAAYAQFAPDVSGGVREVAVTLTDQASGPVAARQRTLRQYANQTGDLTLWGHEFAQQFTMKSVSGTTTNAYKDRGFGFVLGMDLGSRQSGWYGAAFTFYTGDVAGVAPLTSKTNTQWYMLTGYTDWRGRNLFLDTQFSLGYGNLKGRRTVNLGGVSRTAESKRNALMGALGATTGATFNYGAIRFVPHISLDGMTMREEKYRETGGGNGLNLDVGSYYATSLRTFLGADVYTDINMGLFSLRPEARLGYRFDFVTNPVKLETQFVSTGTAFTLNGPKANQNSVLAGFSLGASSETWSLGLHYDWLRGANGNTTQVGTFSLLGRI